MDKAKQQMEFLFEEGGMADDGLDRDPVSGNEVPSGSMSEEVRDDIPAQLSEGEYVVPSDVVRYYGVRFFEDLREDAKEGLTGMEREGRIGGEPVDMEGDDTDLSDEEMAELESIMGMAVGGYVTEQPTQATDPYKAQTELYRSPAPIAIGNTGMQQQQPRGYQAGGAVPSTTQVNPDFSQFGAGYSFMGGAVSDTASTIGNIRTVTLYGPNGEIVTLTLPAQQALYDDLISQGYSTQPPAAQVQTPTVQTSSDDGGAEPPKDPTQERFDRLDKALEDVNMDDPLGAGAAALEGNSMVGRIAGGVIGSLIAGPIGGLLGGMVGRAAQESSNLAEAAVNSEIAGILGYDNTELNTSINNRVEGLSGIRKSFAERAIQNARADAVSAIRDVDAAKEYALTRDKFVSDEAFSNEMQRTAPTGMTYNPATGGYTRTGSAAPTRSPTPTARPSTSGGGSSSGGGSDTSNVGNYSGDRDGDGVPNWRDFDDGVGWADTNKGGGTTTASSRGTPSSAPSRSPTPTQRPDRDSSGGGDSGGGGGGGKIVCTAMNASYGFGSYRQAIWLRYSEKNLTEYHEKGYHKIFLPLVDRAYNRGDKNNKTLRKVLENIARHRTADLRAEMQGKKRDTVGRIYRTVLEPICYIVGRLSK